MYHIYLLSPTSEILNYSPRMQMLTILSFVSLFICLLILEAQGLWIRKQILYIVTEHHNNIDSPYSNSPQGDTKRVRCFCATSGSSFRRNRKIIRPKTNLEHLAYLSHLRERQIQRQKDRSFLWILNKFSGREEEKVSKFLFPSEYDQRLWKRYIFNFSGAVNCL